METPMSKPVHDGSIQLSQLLETESATAFEVVTNYGTVQGRVIFIGFDFLELVEASLSSVIVPYENIVSISPL